MPRTCAFCGETARLTGEHVFGNWLSRIGLQLDPVAHRTGWPNLIGRDVGVTPPFRRTVRDVCGQCNHGWMSRLEDAAKRVLTPCILGESGRIELADHGAIASWFEKTALIAMLVSSEDERAAGYGLPPEEYHTLYDQRAAMAPLPASQVWAGHYSGDQRLASIWVTPLVVATAGLPEPELPHGYAMTLLLGELLLFGVRFTTPNLEVEVVKRDGFAPLWPSDTDLDWPTGAAVDDTALVPLAAAKHLQVTEPRLSIRPWKPATELPTSRMVGTMIELPTICGAHVVYYPAMLGGSAMRGRFHAFMTSCECGTAYLIETAADGAHCTVAGEPSVIAERYEALVGEEIVVEDPCGRFWCKRLPDPA
jgi:hypothetical protein